MSGERLIKSFTLELGDPECLPTAQGLWYRAVASFDADASCVMPYLNAVIDRAEYNRRNSYIRWKELARAHILRRNELAVAPVQDREHAREIIEKAVATVNDAWARKDEIEPDFKERSRLPALEIFKLLPRTNCGECGLASCMAFAVEVSQGKLQASDCPALACEEYAESLERLRAMCC